MCNIPMQTIVALNDYHTYTQLEIFMENTNGHVTVTEMNAERIVYAGHADKAHADFAEMSRHWREYPASTNGIKEAVSDGYTAISNYEFSHPVEKGKAQPTRHGDMVLDFDAKKEVFDEYGNLLGKEGDIDKALEAVRGFIQILKRKCDVEPNLLQYYASGGKGFHVVIPREIIGSELGDIELPAIYHQMLRQILNWVTTKELWDGVILDALKGCRKLHPEDLCIDPNGFKGGKGQLIRLPHIQRADGNYKVPVTPAEIMGEDATFFENIVKADRYIEAEGNRAGLECVAKLEDVYLQSKRVVSISADRINAKSQFSSLETECNFMAFCSQNPCKVSELQWFALARLLSHSGALGNELFRMYSQLDSERYDEAEAQKKLHNARRYSPITCKEIKEVFPCSGDCRVKCPLDLYRKKIATAPEVNNFAVSDEGLLFYPDVNDRTIYEKVSSSVEVKASARDNENFNWSKIVEVRDPDEVLHQCLVPFNSLNGTGEEALTILSEVGLQLEPGKQARQRLIQYLNKADPKLRALIVEKNGWVEKANRFVPFDLGIQGGHKEYLCSRFPVASKLFEAKGTLAEWKENVGGYCVNNPLLQLAILAAISGPSLEFMGHSGFGIHFYGNSSSGKTTNLHLAASVTGGEMKSWRATDNGLEAIAEQHNDNCLLLDEISQCDPDVVGQVAYMLANGQGKTRSSKNCTSRYVPSWCLSFLSSGEESIAERANQGYRNKAMAGHEVRVINILADGDTDHGIFTVVPEEMSAGEFADKLVQNAKQYRGAPLRTMIEHIKNDRDNICDEVSGYMDSFLDGIKLMELSSQAKRVADHFALLAGVGEAAIKLAILPWAAGAAGDAMKTCFGWWLRDKNGTVDFEIEKATEKLLSLARNNFYGKCGNGSPVTRMLSDGKDCYMIPRSYVIAEICKQYQYKKLVKSLKDKEMLILSKDNEVREQFWHGQNSNRPRGFAIIVDKLFSDNEICSAENMAPDYMKSLDNKGTVLTEYGTEF